MTVKAEGGETRAAHPMERPNSTPTEAISRPRMPELDSLRGVAVLAVVCFHYFGFTAGAGAPLWERAWLRVATGGWVGVDLFFVLSGFLITGILIDSRDRPHFFSRFYYRRALRILPVYYAILLVMVGLNHLSFFPRHVSWAFAGLSVAYLSNVSPLFGVPMQFGPLWSLSVEEHFYLIWPLAVRKLARQMLLWLAVAICVAELPLRWIAAARGGLWFGPYTWLSAEGLALGAIVAIFARSAYASRRNLLRLGAAGLLAGLAAIVLSFVASRSAEIALRGTAVSYFMLFIVCGVLWIGTGAKKSWVDWRVLKFYGFISYGLYLFHVPVLDFYDGLAAAYLPAATVGHSFLRGSLRFVIALLIATGLAYLSRVTYEEYFLKKKDRFASIPQRLKPH